MTHTTSPEAGGGRTWTRRSVLRAVGLGTAGLAMPARWSTGAPAPIPVALQLYSVRDDCRKDFDAALAQVAAMGVAGVEFAGYYHYEGRPAELRKRLDGLNLRVAGTHVGTGALADEVIERTIEFHQAIGCRFLIVPGDAAFTDPERSQALAETFNRTAARLKPLGMACGFHNHKGEFATDGGKTYWDLFAERTVPDVILQQDCGWTAAAGLDPVDLSRGTPAARNPRTSRQWCSRSTRRRGRRCSARTRWTGRPSTRRVSRSAARSGSSSSRRSTRTADPRWTARGSHWRASGRSSRPPPAWNRSAPGAGTGRTPQAVRVGPVARR